MVEGSLLLFVIGIFVHDLNLCPILQRDENLASG